MMNSLDDSEDLGPDQGRIEVRRERLVEFWPVAKSEDPKIDDSRPDSTRKEVPFEECAELWDIKPEKRSVRQCRVMTGSQAFELT